MMNYTNIDVAIICCIIIHSMMAIKHVQQNQDEVENAYFMKQFLKKKLK